MSIHSRARRVRTIVESRDRLAYLQSMSDGWMDGEGTAPTKVAVDIARRLVDFIHERGISLPGLFPTTDGGVSAEWADRGRILEVEINPDGSASLMYVPRGSDSDAIYVETADLDRARKFVEEHTVM